MQDFRAELIEALEHARVAARAGDSALASSWSSIADVYLRVMSDRGISIPRRILEAQRAIAETGDASPTPPPPPPS